MMKTTSLRLSLCFLLMALFCLPLSAQRKKKNKMPVKVIHDCEYEVVAGLAEILSIEKVVDKEQSFLGIDEYAVNFQFEAKEGQLMNTLQEQDFRFFLRSDTHKLNVGPEYIKAYQLREGTRYALKILQRRKGNCPDRHIYGDLGGMPNDLFEIRGEKLDNYKAKMLEMALAEAEAKMPQPEEEPEFPIASTEEEIPAEPELSEEERRILERKKKEEEDKRKAEEAEARFREEELKRLKNIEETKPDTEETPPAALVETLPSAGDKNDGEKPAEPGEEKPSDIDFDPEDFDREKLREEMEEKLRLEMEQTMRKEMEEKARLEEERKKQEEEELRKQQEKNEKLAAKEDVRRKKREAKEAKKQAKEEAKQKELDAERQREEEARRQRQLEAEKEQIKRELEGEIRLKLEAEAEEKRKAEEEAAAKAAAEAERQQRKEDERKRTDCKFKAQMSGVITITEVTKIKEAEESYLGYAEYQVKYKFNPDNLKDLPKAEQKLWEEEHVFVLDPWGKSANPSSTYIKSYSVFQNTQYKGFVQVLDKGICAKIIAFSPLLPIDAKQVK